MFDFLISVQNLGLNKHFKNVTYFNTNETKNLSIFDVAILGVSSEKNIVATNNIRKEFSKLFLQQEIDIIDFGNIIEQNNYDEVIQQIIKIQEQTIKNNLKLIVIGETEKYNIAYLNYYTLNSEKFSFLSIGAKINLSEENQNKNPEKYLDYFINNDIIENLYHLGYQNFLVNPAFYSLFNENNYNAFRLSDVKSDFLDFEPYFRTADVVSMNLGAIKYADSPGSNNPQPAGFDATEFCKLSYFAGLSKTLKVFGIYNYDINNDKNNITAKLCAQAIWYYLEAFADIKNNMIDNKDDFSVFHFSLEKNKKEFKLKFIHYEKIDLWWLAINKADYDQLIPCSFNDYNKAKNGELSNRIQLIFEKYTI